MTLKRKIMSGLAVIAFLAVAAAGSLFWFNWWLRFGSTRIYPVCKSSYGYMELTTPLTTEANAMFYGNMLPFNEGYVWIEEGNVIAKNWYWLFGEAELVQRTNYFLEELAKSQSLDPDEYVYCRHLALIGTPAHSSDYVAESYPSNFTRDTLEPLSFGVSSERAGHFTAVGRFYQWLGQVTGQQ
ncbi:exported hypothetical protein [Rhodospirillaceae bacterium LM-1]|nr:exported hypothetical protein [Rhodospirillaceae bacterium LM-1]